MTYDITKIFTLGSLQCSLITALLYMIPLKKREKFLLRFLSCAVICLLAAPFLRMYQTITTTFFLNSSSTISRLFRTLFGVGGDLTLNLLLIGTVVVICCQLSWQKSLYCSVCAYLTQDIAYTIFVLILPSAANRGARSVQVDTLWVELLIMILVYGSFFFLFARSLSKDGDYRFPCVRSLPAMLIIIYIGRMLGAYAKMSFDTQGSQIFSFMLVYDVLCMLLFLLGMAFLLSTMMTFFQDTQFLWGVASMMWMYFTPIFYTENIIPASMRTLYHFNPMYQFISFARVCIIDGVSPVPMQYVYCALSGLVAFVIGVSVFRKHQDDFIFHL